MRSAAAAAEAEVVQGFPIIHSTIYLFIYYGYDDEQLHK
jgi:hypothetical protein